MIIVHQAVTSSSAQIVISHRKELCKEESEEGSEFGVSPRNVFST